MYTITYCVELVFIYHLFAPIFHTYVVVVLFYHFIVYLCIQYSFVFTYGDVHSPFCVLIH